MTYYNLPPGDYSVSIKAQAVKLGRPLEVAIAERNFTITKPGNTICIECQHLIKLLPSQILKHGVYSYTLILKVKVKNYIINLKMITVFACVCVYLCAHVCVCACV